MVESEIEIRNSRRKYPFENSTETKRNKFRVVNEGLWILLFPYHIGIVLTTTEGEEILKQLTLVNSDISGIDGNFNIFIS